MVFEKGVVAIVDNQIFINRDYFGKLSEADIVNNKGVVSINGGVVKPLKLNKNVAVDCFGVLKNRTTTLVLPDGVNIVIDGTMRNEPEEMWSPPALRPLRDDDDTVFHFEDIFIKKENDFWVICSKWKIPLLSKSTWEIKYSIENGKFALVERE